MIEYRSGYLAVRLDEGEWVTFTRKAWKDGFFKGLHLVGPDLVERRIAGVTDVRPKGLFGGWDLLGGQRLSGKLVVEAERSLDFDELKHSVSRSLLEDGFWRRVGIENDVEQAIADADDFWELVDALNIL